MFTTMALALAIVSLPAIFAQDTFSIQVGLPGQVGYNPTFVNANPGDLLNFIFYSDALTVTQSSFSTPCIPTPNGADTGFVDVTENQIPLPVRQLQVPLGSGPLWFHCAHVGHCGGGMVFAINPPTTGNTFQKFQALAIAQNGTSSNTALSVTPTPPAFTTATVTVTANSPSSTGGAVAAARNVGLMSVLAAVGVFILVL